MSRESRLSLAKEASIATSTKVADDLSDGKQVYYMLGNLTREIVRKKQPKAKRNDPLASPSCGDEEKYLIVEVYGEDGPEFHQWEAKADGDRKVVITYEGKLEPKK